MSKTMNASEFKAKCLAVLEEVARTGEPVTILKRGKAVAQVTPTAPVARFPQETLTGTVEVIGDILGPVVPAEGWETEGERRP